MVVFVAIGHETNTEIFRNQIELDNKGYMKKYEGSRTSVEGVPNSIAFIFN